MITPSIGMIGLSGGDKWIQKAIRFFIKSDYSHSFTIVNGPFDGLSVIETTDSIVCMTPLDRKLNERNWVDLWQITDATQEEIKKANKIIYYKYSAMTYGYFSYIWFMYRWLCKKFKYEPKKMWSWCNKGVTCSELSSYGISILNDKYSKIFEGIDLNTISPKELEFIFKNNPNLFRYVGKYVSKETFCAS